MTDERDTAPGDEIPGSNASGNQDDTAITNDSVDSGQSEDIESSLTQQGTSDRETLLDQQHEGDEGSDVPHVEPLH